MVCHQEARGLLVTRRLALKGCRKEGRIPRRRGRSCDGPDPSGGENGAQCTLPQGWREVLIKYLGKGGAGEGGHPAEGTGEV